MTLLTEINNASKVVDVKKYINDVIALDIDPNDRVITDNIITMIEMICGDDINTIIEEGRSEWQAYQDMAKGYGIKDPTEHVRKAKANRIIARSRLGLRATQPQRGEYVKIAGDGIGRVESVEGDVVRIKPNNSPYPIETPLEALVPREVTDKKGNRRIVWVERFKR